MCVTDLDIIEPGTEPAADEHRTEGTYRGVAWGQLGAEAQDAEEAEETGASR